MVTGNYTILNQVPSLWLGRRSRSRWHSYAEPSSMEEGMSALPLLASSVKEICELRKAAMNSAALTAGPTRQWQSVGVLTQKPVPVPLDHTCKLTVYMGVKKSRLKLQSRVRPMRAQLARAERLRTQTAR